MAPRPNASTTALSPIAPRHLSGLRLSRISPFGGSAVSVNHRPGKPAICRPILTPLPPIAVIMLDPAMPSAASIIDFVAAIKRLRNMLGDFAKKPLTSEFTNPPFTRLANSSNRYFVDMMVRPWQSSPWRKPDDAIGISSMPSPMPEAMKSNTGPLIQRKCSTASSDF